MPRRSEIAPVTIAVSLGRSMGVQVKGIKKSSSILLRVGWRWDIADIEAVDRSGPSSSGVTSIRIFIKIPNGLGIGVQ
jgi:hypothetical protein